jgi:ribose 5-phosphate isomerase B
LAGGTEIRDPNSAQFYEHWWEDFRDRTRSATMSTTIYLGADHAGFDLKNTIKEHLQLTGFHVEDLGAHTLDPTDDYPQYAAAVAQAVINHPGSFGILSCGNAEGICIAANKFDGIRAGLGYSEEAAKTMRADDNANILCLPGRLPTEDDPLGITAAFLAQPFSGAPRHIRRLRQLEALEHDHPNIRIIPTLLTQTEDTFRERITHPAIRKRAALWQVDILDGSLYDARTWADPAAVAAMGELPDLELHLMIKDPLPVINKWLQHVHSVKRAIIHAEIPQNVSILLQTIKELGLEAGLALNPETTIDSMEHEISQADLVMLMGVHPGASGDPFLGSPILRKIKAIRTKFPHIHISIDGGVNRETAPMMVKAGAHYLCSGSAIWKFDDPGAAYDQLMQAGR